MYAIIEVGGKQYTVKKGDVIQVEKLDTPEGEDIIIKNVLLASSEDETKIGQPYLKGATVTAHLVKQTKAKKVVSFKYRRRKSSHWTKGHRQQLTELKIAEINVG